MTKKTIEDRFKKLTPIEHILKRPGMYIGNVYTEPTKMFVFEDINEIKGNKFINKIVDYNAGFIKLYDEILTNASDHYIRTSKVTYIKINVDKEHIIIENDGPGIPIEMHKEHKIYIPELALGNIHSGENFNDSEKRLVGGLHGLGASLSNIFSTKFIIETADGKNKYIQTFTDNMSKKSKPTITKSNKNYTKITYYPDFEKFGLSEISDEIQSIFLKRAMDIAAYNTSIKVYYNSTLIPIKSFKDYMKMFINDDEELFYEKINDNWEIGIARSSDDIFQQISMVNGISTHIGGTHVNYIINQIVKLFGEKIEKSNKNTSIKQSMIKNHLFLFLNCKIPNPSFETQTKENLTTKMTSEIIKDAEVSENFIKKLMSSEIKNDIVNFASLKEFQDAKKSTQNGQKVKIRIAKLDDANKAGKSPDNMKCGLILTEGDSAKSSAKSGLSVVGNDYYGIFPLRGKPLNVRDITLQKMRENEEAANIISALGLEFGKKYTTTRTLRYGKVIIMADADCDGHHIRGLLINMLDCFWPSLLELDFIYDFVTPIVKATKKNQTLYFYSLKEYEKWKSKNNYSDWHFKWLKGLGTLEPHEMKNFFKDLNKHLIKFNISNIKNERDLIDLAFNKKRAENRKDWLLKYTPNSSFDKFITKQTYESFFNNEFIEFSMSDNIRSIPNIMDGFKPSQRKIIYTLFKRKFKDEVKVNQLGGSVTENSAYHHGNVSLEQTIVGMAQKFVGSNNINLLEPIGQFGTRLIGGKDSAASRYLFTKLSPLTRDIFKQEDDEILEYLVDDGYQVEPKYYTPIIPIVLVNGSNGIGTGWSSYVPQFNPTEIINYIENKLKNKKLIELKPWYKGFKGEIIKDNDRYISRGIFKKLPNNKLNILELPIMTWNEKYYEFLDKLLEEKYIKDYDKYCTDENVNIIITIPEEIFNTLTDDIIIKKFNLESYISMSNMNLFDENGKIYSYKDQYEIIDKFIELRIKYYELRKQNILNKFEEEKKYLVNKMKFINCVLKKEIVFENKTKDIIIKQIESKSIEMYKDSYDYLINISLISLSKEKLEELKNSYDKIKLQIEKVMEKSETEMWLMELEDLKKKLKTT